MPESPTTIRALTTALVDLGSTVDQVADTLLLHGVTGVPRNGGGCPITCWVKRQVPEVAHLFRCVSDGPWLWIDADYLHGYLPDGARVRIPLPVAVVDFIDAFDAGQYRRTVAA